MESLYININWNGSTTISNGTPDSTTGSDKLWTPSIAEIYSLLGGGDLVNISGDWSSINNKIQWTGNYWLRTPERSTDYYGCIITRAGETDFAAYSNTSQFVRPMFVLEV